MNRENITSQTETLLQEILKLEQGLKNYYKALNNYYSNYLNPHKLFTAINALQEKDEEDLTDEELGLAAQAVFDMMNE